MDRKSDEGGRLTPLERLKHQHDFKRTEILLADDDEIEWDNDIMPEQVGLQPVYADSSDHLWVIIRKGDKIFLKRIWHIS